LPKKDVWIEELLVPDQDTVDNYLEHHLDNLAVGKLNQYLNK